MKLLIKITLLSDMCCGTGGGNGSSIDTMTSFDDAGFPIIPGKRLKGLLRNCGQDLVKYGHLKQSEVNYIFGATMGEQGIIRVDNAAVEHYEVLSKEIRERYNSSAVSKAYTGIRTQTAIDSSGVSEKLSLRTIQIVKRGTVFIAQIELYDKAVLETLEKCIKLLRHIGLNKTRGFGEVACEVIACKDDFAAGEPEYVKADTIETISYTITLDDDVVISTGSNLNIDYISGTMLMGALARFTKDKAWFSEVILNNTVFSNAYIADDDFSYAPTPLSILGIKNEEKQAFDLTASFIKDESKQYVPLSPYSVISDDKIYIKKIRTRMEYHYTTGGINAPKNIFTFRKLDKAQVFKGTLSGDRGALELIKAVMAENNNILYMGGSATAQYAQCHICFGEESIKEEEIFISDTAVIEFLSDIVLTDRFGNNSTNIKVLEDAVRKIIAFNECTVFSKTNIVGGFNSKWRLPRRQYMAFSKGTVLLLKGCKETKIGSTGFIGMFVNEGYGQYRVRNIGRQQYDISGDNVKALDNPDKILSEPTKKLIESILLTQLDERALEVAVRNANKANINGIPASSVMRFLYAYQKYANETKLYEKLKKYVDLNFKDALKTFSKNAIYSFNIEDLTEGIEGDADNIAALHEDALFREYIRMYIAQVKRRYQKEAGK